MTWNDVRKQSLYKLWRKVEERKINFTLIANAFFLFFDILIFIGIQTKS